MTWGEVGNPGSLRQGPFPPGSPLDPIPVDEVWRPCDDMVVGSLRQGQRTDAPVLGIGLGGGASLDMSIPQNIQQLVGNTADSGGAFRQGRAPVGNVGSGQAPGGSGHAVWKGRPSQYHDAQGAGRSEIGASWIDFHRQRGGAEFRGDRACWRVKGLMAAVPTGSGDLGLMVKLENDQNAIKTGIGAGLLLRPNADNTVTFYARAVGGGGLTFSDECPIDLDVSDFNMYEYRFLGATADQPAILKVLINDLLMFQVDYESGLLPGGAYNVWYGSRAGGRLYVAMMGVNIKAGPTEDSTI